MLIMSNYLLVYAASASHYLRDLAAIKIYFFKLIRKVSLTQMSNVRLFEIILKVLLKMHEIFDIQDCVV